MGCGAAVHIPHRRSRRRCAHHRLGERAARGLCSAARHLGKSAAPAHSLILISQPEASPQSCLQVPKISVGFSEAEVDALLAADAVLVAAAQTSDVEGATIAAWLQQLGDDRAARTRMLAFWMGSDMIFHALLSFFNCLFLHQLTAARVRIVAQDSARKSPNMPPIIRSSTRFYRTIVQSTPLILLFSAITSTIFISPVPPASVAHA